MAPIGKSSMFIFYLNMKYIPRKQHQIEQEFLN